MWILCVKEKGWAIDAQFSLHFVSFQLLALAVLGSFAKQYDLMPGIEVRSSSIARLLAFVNIPPFLPLEELEPDRCQCRRICHRLLLYSDLHLLIMIDGSYFVWLLIYNYEHRDDVSCILPCWVVGLMPKSDFQQP